MSKTSKLQLKQRSYFCCTKCTHSLWYVTEHNMRKTTLNIAATDRLDVSMHYNSVASLLLTVFGWLEAWKAAWLLLQLSSKGVSKLWWTPTDCSGKIVQILLGPITSDINSPTLAAIHWSAVRQCWGYPWAAPRTAPRTASEYLPAVLEGSALDVCTTWLLPAVHSQTTKYDV